ncbi:MAG: WavE lipopolysaccharide synthesis family protein [Patescibacteria group bacterium]
MWLLAAWEHATGTLLTFHTRPLYASGVTHTSHPLVTSPSCTIVLQGPVLHTERFTLETVRLYKKIYPWARIVVSTWEGEDTEDIEKEGVEVLYNSRPAYRGPYNVNLQIISAREGVRRAVELGTQYALKTRTDQRMYNPNIFESMVNALTFFPSGPLSKQHSRLLFATGGNIYRPYLLPDMFVFGDARDMLEYWDAPLVAEGAPNPGNDSIFRPELYLGSTFLNKKGWQLDWTTTQMWDIYRECFVFFDWSEIDLYWYKYHRYSEYDQRKRYEDRSSANDLMGFMQWLNIMSNKENKRLPDNAHLPHANSKSSSSAD